MLKVLEELKVLRNSFKLRNYRIRDGSIEKQFSRLKPISCVCVDSQRGGPEENEPRKYLKSVLALLGLSGFTAICLWTSKVAASEKNFQKWHKAVRKDLPTYKMSEVRKHNNAKTRIWVTYGVGVYDITDFVPEHPGGDESVMMAAGGAIDPFWALYQQHNTEDICTLLETFRIGNLDQRDVSTENIDSIWLNEPKRSPILKTSSERPFNGEPPLKLLVEKFLTSNEIFYVRNHLPVPVIDPDTYELDVEIEQSDTSKTFSLDEIKKLPKYTVTAAVVCGGNRRSEMAKLKPVKGLSWDGGAAGNAQWSGAKLRDILLGMGVTSDEKRHVIFEGCDLDPTSHPYGASIPLSKAMDERGDVILAYEMNGETLSRDHGFPLRVIVPGIVGARNVKWLSRIAVSDNESSSHWQQNDYKGFSPSTDWDTVDFTKSPAIQAMPVTSAICSPAQGEKVQVKDGCISVKGYAWSGGGRRIIRVDLTADGGETWHVAELEQEDLPDGRHYGWSLWSANLPVPVGHSEVEIWAKAVDSAYNTQPESFKNTWNLRGLLSNAYHRVKVKLQ